MICLLLRYLRIAPHVFTYILSSNLQSRRSPISRRMCVDGLQMVRDPSMLAERQVRKVAAAAAAAHHHQQQQQQHQLQQQQQYVHSADAIRCPHHVALPDSEWGPDRNIHLQTQYQVNTNIVAFYLYISTFYCHGMSLL